MAFTTPALRKIEYPTNNYIINGDMYFSQRGTFTSATTATNGAYHLDRWSENIVGVTATIQQLTAVSVSASTKAVRLVPTSNGAGNIGVRHNFEMDPRWLGNPVVFSALLRSNSSYARLLVQTDQGNFYSDPHSGSGDWELLVVRPTFSTIVNRAGCILGGTSFGNPTITTSMYIDMTDASFVLGMKEQEFVPYGGDRLSELLACQRYYEKTYSASVAPGTNTAEGAWQIQTTSYNDGRVFFPIRFSVEKYAVATMNFYTISGTLGSWTYERSGVGATTAVMSGGSNIGTSGGTITMANIGLGWVPAIVYGHWTAQAEF